MIPIQLDIFGDILTAIAAFFLIGLVIAVAIGYAIYRAISSQPAVVRAGITAGFILIGLVLIITVVGANIGVISLLTGAFISIFSAVKPHGEAES